MNYTLIMQYVLIAFLWLGAVLQAAVVRDRSLIESQFSTSGRIVLVVGLMGLALRFTFLMFDKGALGIPIQSVMSMVCVGLGAIIIALGKMLSTPGMEWTSPPPPWCTKPGEFDTRPHNHLRRAGERNRK